MGDVVVDSRLFHQQVADPLALVLAVARPQLVSHRNDDYPNEAVGILCVDGTCYPLINQARSPKRFEVSQLLVAEAIAQLKVRKRHPVAIYHSHPTSDSGPSNRDVMMMQEMPQASFVIVGNDGIAAWMWDDELRFIVKIPLKEDVGCQT